jgi:hypothetical protein
MAVTMKIYNDSVLLDTEMIVGEDVSKNKVTGMKVRAIKS